MDGPGRLLGYHTLHKKVREVYGLNVPRNLVYGAMWDFHEKDQETKHSLLK